MASDFRPPLWGNFVAYADEDLLAFGLLINAHLGDLAFYHGTQAIEKYLKALALAILDPTGTQETPDNKRCLRTHDLVKLADCCKAEYRFYGLSDIQNHLKRISEFDQVSRYPWTSQELGNGFSSDDIPVIGSICKQLRRDLPIAKDNYKLGMEVRGYFHGDRTRRHPASMHYSHDAVNALRLVLPDIDDFVRGWDPCRDGAT